MSRCKGGEQRSGITRYHRIAEGHLHPSVASIERDSCETAKSFKLRPAVQRCANTSHGRVRSMDSEHDSASTPPSSPVSRSTRTSLSSVEPCLTAHSSSKNSPQQTPHKPQERRRSQSARRSSPTSSLGSSPGRCIGEHLEHNNTRFQPYPRRHTLSNSKEAVDQAPNLVMTTDICPTEVSIFNLGYKVLLIKR